MLDERAGHQIGTGVSTYPELRLELVLEDKKLFLQQLSLFQLLK